MEWIQNNWKDIVIYSGLLIAFWNGLIAFLKVMGYPQIATWCQKLEDALSAAFKAFVDSRKPPTGGIA